MKKILLLGSVCLLSTSLVLGATPSITTQTTSQTPKTTSVATPSAKTASVDDALESAARNIDRRLAYFNRYKQQGDIESIKKLISEENKDFSINFVNFVKQAPLFTIKRDISQKVVKTPLGDFVLSVIVSSGGKDTKASITFVVEKTTQGAEKWLISDSNIHIQKTGNLASSALGSTTKPSNTPTTTKPTPSTTSTATTKPTTSTAPKNNTPTIGTPVVKKPEEGNTSTTKTTSEKTKNTTNTAGKKSDTQKTLSEGLGIMTITLTTLGIIIGIGIGIFWIWMLLDCIRRTFAQKTLWILLLVFLGTPASIAYYFMIKRKYKTIPPATNDSTKLVPPLTKTEDKNSDTNTMKTYSPTPAPNPPVVPPTPVSNVSVSTVEKITQPITTIPTPAPAVVSAIPNEVTPPKPIPTNAPTESPNKTPVTEEHKNAPSPLQTLPIDTNEPLIPESMQEEAKEIQSLQQIMNAAAEKNTDPLPENIPPVTEKAPQEEIGNTTPHPLFENIFTTQDKKTV